MTTMPNDDGSLFSGIWTTVSVAGISIVGAVTKCAQWVDAKDGKFSWGLMFSGVAACLILAAAVRALGEQYHAEPWAQVMFSGVLCYIGPDPIIRALASIALKRFGIGSDVDAVDGKKP